MRAQYTRELETCTMHGIGEIDLTTAWDDFRDASDDAIAAVGPIIASIVESVLAAFPGLGTALSTAIASGIALAMGKPIEEVIISAAGASIPGGPLAVFGFENAIRIGAKLARGEGVDQIAAETIRANLPSGVARVAFDAGVNLVQGRDVGDAALNAVRAQLPAGVARTAFDTSVKIARGERVDQAAIDLVRANLSPLELQAFDFTIAVARGEPVADLAIAAGRAAAAKQGSTALRAFDLALPLARGALVNAAALATARAGLSGPDAAAFDQAVSIAHAKGLQDGGFLEASTFMRWAPSVWGTDRDLGGSNYDPHQHKLTELLLDFGDASEYAQRIGVPVLALLERYMLDDLAALPVEQFDLYSQIIGHLEQYRSDFELDLQDTPADVLAPQLATYYGRPVSDAITRAALGSVPYTKKPPFSDRKSKRRGEADISASFQAAIPAANARRARFTNAIAMFRDVDARLVSKTSAEQVYKTLHAFPDQFGGEAGRLTIDQVYARLKTLSDQGLAPPDFPEWHLSPDTEDVARTWKNEADFLAAKTLANADEYRKRAKLETELANRVLEGTASGEGKALLDKAAADLARAASLDLIELAHLVNSPAGQKLALSFDELPPVTARELDAASARGTAAGAAQGRADVVAAAAAAQARTLAEASKDRQKRILGAAGAAGALLVLGALLMRKN